MPRTHTDALTWVEHCTQLLAAQVAALDEQAMTDPSALPGWTRKHLGARRGQRRRARQPRALGQDR